MKPQKCVCGHEDYFHDVVEDDICDVISCECEKFEVDMPVVKEAVKLPEHPYKNRFEVDSQENKTSGLNHRSVAITDESNPKRLTTQSGQNPPDTFSSIIAELEEKNFKEREEDDRYWSEEVVKPLKEEIKNLKSEVSKWKAQYNSKLKRDDNIREIEKKKAQKLVEDAIKKSVSEECGWGNHHINAEELKKELFGDDLK